MIHERIPTRKLDQRNRFLHRVFLGAYFPLLEHVIRFWPLKQGTCRHHLSRTLHRPIGRSLTHISDSLGSDFSRTTSGGGPDSEKMRCPRVVLCGTWSGKYPPPPLNPPLHTNRQKRSHPVLVRQHIHTSVICEQTVPSPPYCVCTVPIPELWSGNEEISLREMSPI